MEHYTINKVMDQKLATQPLKTGHKYWEYNTITKNITEAEIEMDYHNHFDQNTQTPVRHHKLIMKENCEYTSALNLKNAKRKFKNL